MGVEMRVANGQFCSNRYLRKKKHSLRLNNKFCPNFPFGAIDTRFRCVSNRDFFLIFIVPLIFCLFVAVCSVGRCRASGCLQAVVAAEAEEGVRTILVCRKEIPSGPRSRDTPPASWWVVWVFLVDQVSSCKTCFYNQASELRRSKPSTSTFTKRARWQPLAAEEVTGTMQGKWNSREKASTSTLSPHQRFWRGVAVLSPKMKAHDIFNTPIVAENNCYLLSRILFQPVYTMRTYCVQYCLFIYKWEPFPLANISRWKANLIYLSDQLQHVQREGIITARSVPLSNTP